jgi:predicted Holliday junction resolvase-like endonuclease
MLLFILAAVILTIAFIANFKKIKALVSSVEAKVEQVSETVSPVLQDVEKMIDQAAAAAPKNEVIAKAKTTTAQVKQALPKAKAPKKAK